jgi:Uma2 family endonuclease
VWIINPKTQTADVYTAPDEKKRLSRRQKLEGKDVLPEFALPLKELFDRAEE